MSKQLLEKTLVKLNSSLKEVIKVLDGNGLGVALVADDDLKLYGIITDGDIRRALLKSESFQKTASEIMNANPVVAYKNESLKALSLRMKKNGLRQIPIIDNKGHLLEIKFQSLLSSNIRDNLVVLMAGGLGKRLSPRTNNYPKPLLKVGGKPISEIILCNFIEHGFRNFVFTLNYKGDAIRNHFGDGSFWGANISFIKEGERLGTAGALGLLPSIPDKPFIVMNSDLLTKVNFDQLLDFHIKEDCKATMCVREYDFEVPFGVVELDSNRITKIKEKPVHKFLINAGIYVLDPEVLRLIPVNEPLDMPALFAKFIDKNIRTTVFPIHEYWLDIGREMDLERANNDYSEW